MKINHILDLILHDLRIPNVLLSKITSIHTTTISMYRNNHRNIGKQSFEKIYEALTELNVPKKNMKELRMQYENSRIKKIL